MSFNKKFFTTGGIVAASEGVCLTEDVNPFTGEVADGGVALYSLDYDASDAGGYYDGTPDSAVEFGVAGVTNYGARFSSTTTGIVNTSLQLNSTAHSISLWVKPAEVVSGRWNTIFMSYFLGHPSGFLGKRSDQSTYFHYRTESGNELYFTLASADTWYHIVITRDSGGVDIYVDGSFVTSNSDSMGTYPSSSYEKTAIGSNPIYTGEYFNGDIDQVRIFSKALNQTEVDTLYNNGDGETACVYDATATDNYYPLADGDTDAVAYYKLDNSSEDYVGSNDGTDTNIEYRFGRFGQAAVFSANGYISGLPTVENTSNEFSISLWFNTTENPTVQHTMLGGIKEQGANDSVVAFKMLNDGYSKFYLRGTDGTLHVLADTVDATDGNWHHLVGTVSSSSGVFYVDGQQVDSATISNNITVDNLLIGAENNRGTLSPVNYFNGSIDQVRIYSTALDSDQVAELYNEKPEVDTSNFKAVLYEGNGGSQYISNVGFQPDLVWVKNRDTSGYYHNLYDSIRGATYRLFSNLPNAHDSNGVLSSFDANGFYLTGAGDANASGQSIIAWVWKGGGDAVNGTGSGVTNVSVSANTEAGFSIVKYTGSGAAGMTVGHGLTEAIPELVIIKNLDNTTNWQVFGGSLFTRMQLDQTGDDDLNLGLTITSTTIQTTQTSGQEGNSAWNANDDYIAYCWHSVSGYSKIGTYEGTNSTVTVSDVGFKPSFVMIKNIDDSADWVMLDNRRNTIDDRLNNWLRANDDAQETGAVSTAYITVNDNGFIVASATSLGTNADGDTYIYMAFK